MNNIFSFFLGNIIYAEYAGILMPAEQCVLGPSDIVGYAVLKKSTLNKLLAVRVGHLTQLYFIIDFHRGI
jgi:hypothetical protein